MASVTITSYRKEREAEIVDSLTKKMERVGAIVERQAKKNVTRPGPSGKMSHWWKDTDRLAASVMHRVTTERDGIVAEIGTNVDYGTYLEFGTSRMPSYPWLFPALELKRAEIVEILKGREVGFGGGAGLEELFG